MSLPVPVPEGSKQKHARYPAYKDSGVEWLGEIPVHWDLKKLKHVTTCLDGKRVPLNSEQRGYIQGGYPYWGANGILDYIDNWLFDEQLILLGEDGAPFFEANKTVAFLVEGKIWVNNHAHVLRVLNSTNARFLTNVLNVVQYRQFIEGSTRDKLTQDSMNNIPIQFAPIQEQQTIADYLDKETEKIDQLVEKKKRLIELLKEQRTAIITHAVTKGLNPGVEMKDSGVEWLGEIPAHWEVKKLKTIVKLSYGASLPDEQRIENLIPVFGSNGLVGYHNKANTIAPCIIVGRKGSFGKVVYSDTPSFAIDTTYYIDNHSTKAYIRWLYYCLLCLDLDSFSKDSAVPGLSREDAYSKLTPYCQKVEQQTIADYLDKETARIDNLINKINQAIEKLQEYRSALITAAVTGKIDVRQHVS